MGEWEACKPVRVWIDGQHYDFNRRLTTGTRLRRAAGIPDDFELWYEAPVPDREDVLVPKGQGFALLDGARYYSSPRTIQAGSEPLQDGGERPEAWRVAFNNGDAAEARQRVEDMLNGDPLRRHTTLTPEQFALDSKLMAKQILANVLSALKGEPRPS